MYTSFIWDGQEVCESWRVERGFQGLWISLAGMPHLHREAIQVPRCLLSRVSPGEEGEPVLSPRTLTFLRLPRSGKEEETPLRKGNRPFCAKLRNAVWTWWTTATLVAGSKNSHFQTRFSGTCSSATPPGCWGRGVLLSSLPQC